MTGEPNDVPGNGVGVAVDGWPVPIRGIVETVVATRRPNGRWNLAALGLVGGEPVTARTWGRTRTRENFERAGEGVVQFTRDPVDFVDAALAIVEREEPILPSADAWARVRVEPRSPVTSPSSPPARPSPPVDGERSVDVATWALEPVEGRIVRRSVPTINRGFNAVIEASVAASRLDVGSYDEGTLLARLDRLAGIVERCGDPRDLEAMERIDVHTGWTARNESL